MYNRELTKRDVISICENWYNLSYNDKSEIKKYHPEIYDINEMAYTRGMFIGLCGSVTEQITYNLIYIVILGSYEMFYRYVNHWQTELMSYVKRLFDCSVEKSVKKDKIVYDYIVDTYVDQVTCEFDNIPFCERALKDEIRKGSKNPKYKTEVNFIKNKILPNIENIIDEHKQEFAVLYKALVKAFKVKDINIFKQELYNLE